MSSVLEVRGGKPLEGEIFVRGKQRTLFPRPWSQHSCPKRRPYFATSHKSGTS